MTLRPVGSRVFLRPDVVPEPSADAIILADTHFREPETPTSGVIVAIGTPRCPDCGHGLALEFTAGQRVALKPDLAVEEFDWQGETFWSVPLDGIIGVIVEDSYVAA